MKSVRDIDMKGKRALVRAGLNVPLRADGTVGDTYRLSRALATIEYLSNAGARVVLIAHFGRGGESVRPVYDALAALAKTPIGFFDGSLQDARAQTEALRDGDILMLENVRRFAGEETNDPAFARELAALGDVFVNDAFADSHRAHASIVGVPTLLPSCAGLLMEEEVAALTPALTPPSGSLAIIGGAKFETKQPLIEKLLTQYARVCIGGALANDILKARGTAVGASMTSALPVPAVTASSERVEVPRDFRTTTSGAHGTVRVGPEDIIADIGPDTEGAWSRAIEEAPFVLWNGPMGIYEDGFISGTDALARAIDTSARRAIVGGGDTLGAIEKFSFDSSRVFLSTGGGAMLQFLTDGTLVGIEALHSS